MAKIRKRYNQVPHLDQDTTWESNKNTLNITKKSQEVTLSQKVTTRQTYIEQTRKHEKHKEQKNTNDPQKITALKQSVKIFYWRA